MQDMHAAFEADVETDSTELASHGRRVSRLRVLMFAGLGVVLAWQVISRSFVAYLADVAPEVALTLNASHPVALIKLADQKLNLDEKAEQDTLAPDPTLADDRGRLPSFARLGRRSPPRSGTAVAEGDQVGTEGARGTERLPSNASDATVRQEVSTLARTALMQEPISASGLRVLGQIADAVDDEAAATQLMQAAVRRSLRESLAAYWLMRDAFDRKDYAASVRYADILLRTRPQMVAQVIPTLARIAEDKEAIAELKKVLRGDPPWRARFFNALLGAITDARTPLDLLLSIKDTPTPPTRTDLRDYLNLLIKNNFYELAYYVWLQFLPRGQLAKLGALSNGSFESEPTGLPFDWVVAPSSGVTIDFALRQDTRQRALLLEFGPGRADFRGISQFIMLAPGAYQLKGEYTGQLMGRRGLEWRVYCVGAVDPIAKSPVVLGSTPEWAEFETSFTVPDGAGCRAQQVRLWHDARSASEQLATGTVWYDNLQIGRAQPDGAPTRFTNERPPQ